MPLLLRYAPSLSASVQLAVGQGDPGVLERECVGRAARLLLEELVQAVVGGASMLAPTSKASQRYRDACTDIRWFTSTVEPDALRIEINHSLFFLQ